MAKKFIVVTGMSADDAHKSFGLCGKAPRADVAPRFSSLSAARGEAFLWAGSWYYAHIFKPLKGGGWEEVCRFEPVQCEEV